MSTYLLVLGVAHKERGIPWTRGRFDFNIILRAAAPVFACEESFLHKHLSQGTLFVIVFKICRLDANPAFHVDVIGMSCYVSSNGASPIFTSET